MFKLNKKNINNLVLGSLFFGCGGGLPPDDQKRVLSTIIKEKKNLIIKGVQEFKESDCLASMYGVGDPSKTKMNFKRLVQEALRDYQRLTRIKIAGIIPGEIGAESLALQAASYLGVPVVDSDLVGGRAAPEIQMDVFSAYGISITPVLGVSPNKKSILFLGDFAAKEIEITLRDFFRRNGGSGVLIGYPIKSGIFKKFAIKDTISLAIEAGESIAARNTEEVLNKLGGRIVSKEKIEKVNLQSSNGFLRGHISFKGSSIIVKNENVVLLKGKKKLIIAPDLIVLLNESLMPIHNAEIKKYKNKEVFIVFVPALGYWQDKDKRKLWLSALE